MSRLVNWRKEPKNNIDKILLFIISPFLSFIYSLKTINTRSSFVIIFLFSLCFGMAFSVTNKRNQDTSKGSIDGVSYRAKFEEYCRTSNYEYYEGLEDVLSFKGENKDYYFDTVAFYVSRVTDNYHVMFFVFAFVFAFFQLKCLKYLVLNENFKISAVCLLLVLLFSWNQIFNINGMRFWTAAWIGVLSMFKIFYEKKNNYFLLALATPFVHGSYWIFVIVLLLAKLTSKFEKTWIVLFILSIFVSSILLEFAQVYSGFIPSFMEDEFAHYTDAEYVQKVAQGSGVGFYWVALMFKKIVNIYINILVVMLIVNKYKKGIDNNDIKLFRFLLVWMTFCNFGTSIPALGNRFILLSYSIIALLWLNSFKGQKYNWVIYLIPLVFFMAIYEEIKLYAIVTDFYFYISSPFILIPQYLF